MNKADSSCWTKRYKHSLWLEVRYLVRLYKCNDVPAPNTTRKSEGTICVLSRVDDETQEGEDVSWTQATKM